MNGDARVTEQRQISESPVWWQRGIIYQVYPRSFQDSDGDGIGDLPGITSRLDYLKWLGVDAVWISPIYPSPMADFGYDVSDYGDVHPMFGTLDDFDRLLHEAHARGLKVMLDWVPNHTSDDHPWFLESRSARDAAKRDWYLWRDPAPDGGPPTNWLSLFGGSAWEFDEQTGQYYYHAFLKEQPDLNWRNPEVCAAMYDTLRFWLDRGVNGFRVDVMWHMIKDDEYRDNPPNPEPDPNWPYTAVLPIYTTDRPEVHHIVREMRALFDEYDERVIVGEIYLPVEQLVTYYGPEGPGCHLPFNFQLVTAPWSARGIAEYVDYYEGLIPDGGWPNWVLGNHDKSRVATRVGPAQARVAAILLMTLRGTPTMYYGDEIGMRDVPVPIELAQDPLAHTVPARARDAERTPMQWDDTAGAGFTTGTPWLPLAEGARSVNVAVERDDPDSMLCLYRRLIELRRAEPALEIGSYAPVPATGDLLAYLRECTGTRFLVALNLGAAPDSLDLGPSGPRGTVVVSTHRDREGARIEQRIDLRGDEGIVVRLR
jgi:alpha-glucosidase